MTDAAPLEVWVVDDDESIRWVLERALGSAGMRVSGFPGAAELLDAADDAVQAPDVLISDIRMPGHDGLEIMHRVHRKWPAVPVIIITAHSDLDAAVAAFKGGAFEYLPKPFDVDDAVALVRRAAARGVAAPAAAETRRRGAIIGQAPAMQEVFRAIGRLAASRIPVLITGESGTGKELIARALHDSSARAARPFVAINTAAIPRDLMESEFFGHERGAFTGATGQRRGRFEQADGGSLFLDEIGDMPLPLQTRLLRVLQDGSFYRVGGTAPLTADVRILAATHQDLEGRVREGLFREDLYHRINVVRVRVPALRERIADVPLLLRHFLAAAADELDTAIKRIDPAALQRLCDYSWPGNVRQLENVCRWLTVMAPGKDILPQDLPPEIEHDVAPDTSITPASSAPPTPAGDRWEAALRNWARAELGAGRGDLLARAGPAFERAMIEVALDICHGQRREAARRLGCGRNTLTRKIKALGIEQ